MNSHSHPHVVLHLAFGLVSGLLACGIWALSYCSQLHLDHLAASVEQRKGSIARHSELSTVSLRVREELSTVAASLKQKRAKLPAVPEESLFLQELSERATVNGVMLGEFRPGSISKQSNCSEIDLKLRAIGRYANICRWLDSLESLPRLVNIGQFSLTGPAAPGGDCVVDVQLSLLFGLDS